MPASEPRAKPPIYLPKSSDHGAQDEADRAGDQAQTVGLPHHDAAMDETSFTIPAIQDVYPESGTAGPFDLADPLAPQLLGRVQQESPDPRVKDRGLGGTLALVIPVALIVAAVVVLAVYIVIRGPATKPPPKPGSQPAATSAQTLPSPSAAAPMSSNDLVVRLQAVFTQMGSQRGTLVNAVAAKVCNAQAIEQVIAQRQGSVQELNSLNASALEQGQTIVSQAEQALQYSIQSDQQYLTWASNGCHGAAPYPPTDTQANTVKASLAQLWNTKIVGAYPGAHAISASSL